MDCIEELKPFYFEGSSENRLHSKTTSRCCKSPFYKELYKNIRTDQRIVLNDLPIINKTTMMDNFDRFVTDSGRYLSFGMRIVIHCNIA